MSTIFSYDQSADTMSRIKNSRNAISEVFANCDNVAGQLQENIQTTGVSGNQDISQAALCFKYLKHIESHVNELLYFH